MSADKRFHTTSLEFLDFIIDCVDNIRDEGQTNYTTGMVQIARNFLSGYSSETLLDGFIDNHQYWNNIAQKDKKFILEDVPVLYKDIGLDVNIIVLPYKSYITNKDSPITHEDIEMMWDYFTVMVKISCNYIHTKRTKGEPEFRKEIDVNGYATKFNFVPKVDEA